MQPLLTLDEVHMKLCDKSSPVHCCKETLRRGIHLAAENKGNYVEVCTDKELLRVLANHEVIGNHTASLVLLSLPTLLDFMITSRSAPAAWLSPLCKLDLRFLFVNELPGGRTPTVSKGPTPAEVMRQERRSKRMGSRPNNGEEQEEVEEEEEEEEEEEDDPFWGAKHNKSPFQPKPLPPLRKRPLATKSSKPPRPSSRGPTLVQRFRSMWDYEPEGQGNPDEDEPPARRVPGPYEAPVMEEDEEEYEPLEEMSAYQVGGVLIVVDGSFCNL
jgi:hypothetical protein